MLDNGCHTKETYEEFDRLQKTVLKDLPYKDGFDGIKFNGEPFVSPDKLEIKKEKEKLQSEKDNSETPDKSVNTDKKFCNENKKTKRTSILKTLKENKKEISGKARENKEIKKQNGRIL